jgi:hypothetical protein
VLLRLAWRPMTFMGVLLVLPALMLPFHFATDEVIRPLQQLWAGTAPEMTRIALWQAVAFVPAALGNILGVYRLELQHTMLSWQLPRVHHRLAVDAALVMAAVAAAAAVVLARSEAGPAVAAGFALACYTFLLPGFLYDVAVHGVTRRLMALPLAIMFVQPSLIANLARTQSALVLAAFLALAAVQLLPIASAERARLRPFRWSRYLRTSSRARVSSAREAARRWRGSLDKPGILPWLRAAAYETNLRFPHAFLIWAAIAVLTTRLFNNPFLVPVIACAALMYRGHLLSMNVSYPLSRVRRAQLAYLGTLVDAVMLCTSGVLFLVLSLQLPLRPITAQTSSFTLLQWLIPWATAFALAPLAQWGRIRWPATTPPQQNPTMQARHTARLLVFMFSAGVLHMILWDLSEGSVVSTLAAMVAFAVVAQFLHAMLLHQHYTSSDLVSARA